MSRTIKTAKELGEALKNEQDTIEIEGDLKNKVIRIRSTGRVAWIVAIGGIGITVGGVAITVYSGGVATPVLAPVVGSVAAVSFPYTVLVLGFATATAAVAIAKAAGKVESLDKLREYKVIEDSGNRIVLKSK